MTEEKLLLELAAKFGEAVAGFKEAQEAVVCMLDLIHRELIEISAKLDEDQNHTP